MASRPLLLDLFCGAGGAAMGYHRAGFDVVGVDIKPQPRYPFRFIQGDALNPPVRMDAFDLIHASPPCQAYSCSRTSHPEISHPKLVGDVRSMLVTSGAPFIIENVVGAPLLEPIELCGASFGLMATDDDGSMLTLRRHRIFEGSVPVLVPPCACYVARKAGRKNAGVYGGGPQRRTRGRGGYTPSTPVRRKLMGIDWMTQLSLSQAIPPAYTEFIGRAFLESRESS